MSRPRDQTETIEDRRRPVPVLRAQGYLHAQDQTWEMDFRHHITRGRLAELFGEGQVETDIYLRTMGWRRSTSRNGRSSPPDTKRHLQVKEIHIDADDRFLICYNPDAAQRDAAIRQRLLAQLAEAIDGSDKLSATRRGERTDLHQARPQPVPAPPKACCASTPEGQGRVAAARQVSAALLRPGAERRGHRSGLQATPRSRPRLARHEDHLDLRPVFHRREDRIRAHITSCSAGWPCCSSMSPRPRPVAPGTPSAPRSTGYRSACSPAPPAGSPSAPGSRCTAGGC